VATGRQPQYRPAHPDPCARMATRRCGQKRGCTASVRSADGPAQTVTSDLGFVPATPTPHQSLPAVSGSSGRLVLSHRPASDQRHPWPGQVTYGLHTGLVEYIDATTISVEFETEVRTIRGSYQSGTSIETISDYKGGSELTMDRNRGRDRRAPRPAPQVRATP